MGYHIAKLQNFCGSVERGTFLLRVVFTKFHMGRKIKESNGKNKSSSNRRSKGKESKEEEEETTDLWQSESVLKDSFDEIG